MATLWRRCYHMSLDLGSRVCRFLWHWALYFFYMGSGQTVPPIKNPILLKSGTTLALEIREGKIKSEEIVKAYIERIKEVEPFINAIVDQRFDEALNEARQVDELLASGKLSKRELEANKPLLGVPVTIKMLICVKGMRSTAGSIIHENAKSAEDAEVVSLLKKAGVIVLAITNVPEFGLNFETNNYLYGKTCNPYDTSKTSGGSSGGESALISAAGSIIGIGNDIAGSIRLPCMYTGIFGHKPSRGVLSNKGCFPLPSPPLQNFLAPGPMCRYAKDLVITMNVLTSGNSTKMKFGQPVNFKDINIYYMLSMGDVPMSVEVEEDQVKALKQAISYFESRYGTKAKEIKIPHLKRSLAIYAHQTIKHLKDSKPSLIGRKKNINYLEEIVKFLLGKSKYSIAFLFLMNIDKLPTIYNPNKYPLYRKLAEELEENFDTLLDEKSLFFYPTFPKTASFHYEIPFLVNNCAYTAIFNLLGLPVTQCMMGKSKNGLPVGFQIVGRKNNDPLTVACAVELENAFGGWIPPGGVDIEKYDSY